MDINAAKYKLKEIEGILSGLGAEDFEGKTVAMKLDLITAYKEAFERLSPFATALDNLDVAVKQK